jgi:hypothetical protein
MRLLLLGLLISIGCTSTKVAPLGPTTRISPEKSYVLFQYRYQDKDRGDHSLIFGDSEKKTLVVKVDASADTEAGVLFEVPSGRQMQLLEFSDDVGKPFPIDKFNDSFVTAKGRVSVLAPMYFEVAGNRWNYGSLDEEESKRLLKKAVRQYGFNEKDLVVQAGRKGSESTDIRVRGRNKKAATGF